MTMHLEHPALSTTGKRKGKQKFRNAEAARRARQLEESWKELKKRHGVEQEERKQKRALAAPALTKTYEIPAYRNTTANIKSLNSGAGVAIKAPEKVYTGDKIVGIATMHKSNAVPVFSQEDAIAISKMRR